MGLKTLSVRQMEQQTKDIYEAVVVMSQRAKQLLRDRMVEKVMKETAETDFGLFDQVPEVDPETYQETEKSSTQAIDEFMSGDLKWQFRSYEDEE